MKKVVAFIVSFLFLVVVGILLITVYGEFPYFPEKKTNIGIILNGYIDDKSYSQSHYDGLKSSLRDFDIDIIYKENVSAGEEFFKAVEDMVKNDCRIIIANSFNYTDYVSQVAEKYPEIYFFHASGIEKKVNLTSFFGRMYQPRYLSGIVAGLQTKTNEIGYVAAFPIDEVNRGINAFMLGVSLVNPDAKVFVEWTGSWEDDNANCKAAERLIASRNIDVLTMHTDSLGPMKVADLNHIWTVGCNFDNSDSFDNCLTSVVWNWQEFYKVMIPKCLAGKLRGGYFWNGLETNMVRLTDLSDDVINKNYVQAIVDKETERIAVNNWDVFFGPIYDNAGNLRIPYGCCPTDETILNDFKWYVKGVDVSAF